MSRRRRKHLLTHALLIAGLVIQQAIALLAELGAAGIGHGSTWHPVTLAVLGGLLQVLGLLGYTQARAAVDLAQLVGVESEVKP